MENSIAIRTTNHKPGTLVQTQTKGIEFDNGVRYATGDCPKCGQQNKGLYYLGQEEFLRKHGAERYCRSCGIPYRVEIKGE